jgi:hypothetical protein
MIHSQPQVKILIVSRYKLMLQNAISGVKRKGRLCLEQNGEHFQHLL